MRGRLRVLWYRNDFSDAVALPGRFGCSMIRQFLQRYAIGLSRQLGF
jgi:hypothetical protein